MSAATDEELLRDYAQAGSPGALEALVARHWPLAYRVALRALGDPGAAEDAAQESLVWLARGARRFEAGCAFLPWFRTIVGNSVRTALRSRRRRTRHEARAAAGRSGVAPSPVLDAALALEVEERLSSLEPDVRLPLVLHYYEGCSHDEVAQSLGCPKGTASSRIRRGLEQLRESLVGAGWAVTLGDLERWGANASSGNAGVAVPAAPSVAALEGLAKKSTLGVLAVKLAAPLVALLGLVALIAPGVPGLFGAGAAARAASESAASASSRGPAGTGVAPATSEPGPLAGEGPTPEVGPAAALEGVPAAASSALEGERAEPVGEIEADPRPGPYPWREADENEVERRLGSEKVTFEFDGTPMSEALEFFHDMSELPITVEPAFEERARGAKLRLKARDVVLRNAIELVLDAVSEPGFQPGFVADDSGLTFVAERSREPHAYPRPASAETLVSEDAWQTQLDREARQGLATKLVSLHLARVGLEDLVEAFVEQTGLGVALARSVDSGPTFVVAEADDLPAGEALTRVLATADLTWELRHGVIVILPEAERRRPALATRRVSLALRGVSVEDLVEALGKQGVEVIATEEAWRSRGTFSLVLPDAPVSEVVATISTATPFRAQIALRTREPYREVVVVSESYPGARESLALEAPACFPGIAAEVSELRARLTSELSVRAGARRSPEIAWAKLASTEAAVARTVARIGFVVESARRYATVPETVAHWKTIPPVDLEALRTRATQARAEAQSDRADCERERVRFVPGSDDESAFVKEHETRETRLENEAHHLDDRLEELTKRPTGPWVDPEEAWRLLVAGARLDAAEAAATRR